MSNRDDDSGTCPFCKTFVLSFRAHSGCIDRAVDRAVNSGELANTHANRDYVRRLINDDRIRENAYRRY